MNLGLSVLNHVNDESEFKETRKHHVKLVVPRVDPTEVLKPAEHPFDLVAQLTDVFVEIP